LSGSNAAKQPPTPENAGIRVQRLYNLLRLFAHQVRNPLTIIKGDMEVGLLKTRTAEEYQRIMRSNLEEIDRIERLTDDVTAVFQAEAGELKLDRRKLNLNEMIEGLTEKLRKIASPKGLDLTISPENGILVIVADQPRLQQMLTHLIENALAFTPEGGRVEVIVEGRENEAWVTIKDQSSGIPPEELPHIFDPFFEGGRQNYSALSMSLCKAIAQAHNGSLEISSRTGKDSGTEITVRLPV